MKKLNGITNKLNKLALDRNKNFEKIKYKKYNDKYINFFKKSDGPYSEDN